MFLLLFSLLFPLHQLFANPYYIESKVPKDSDYVRKNSHLLNAIDTDFQDLNVEDLDAMDVLRVEVEWNQETYSLKLLEIEKSGTSALIAKTSRPDPFGSYQARLVNSSGRTVAYGAVGTGKEYRKLTRAMSFRFEVPRDKVKFILEAENPKTGIMEMVLSQDIYPRDFVRYHFPSRAEVKLLRVAKQSPAVIVNVYAEGYQKKDEAKFFKDASKAIKGFESSNVDAFDHLELRGVFVASDTELGSAQDLGLPVREWNSFLGLYFPYWNNFGRWYHIVYPTRESKLRRGFSVAPYDYPIALINNSEYWGVGNFMAFTSIPSNNSSFQYLLLHEFGHFLGLNEEYEGGGRTELEFAEGIAEPWSQNITFETNREKLKWKSLVSLSTPIPTPHDEWSNGQPVGAYVGGYADSKPRGRSHKPVMECTMNHSKYFCPVCQKALNDRIKFDGNF